MTRDKYQLQEGQLLTFAAGEYSDYCVNGLYRVETPFNIMEEHGNWAKANDLVRDGHISGKPVYQGDATIEFPVWLVCQRLVVEMDYEEFHTGYYDEHHLL